MESSDSGIVVKCGEKEKRVTISDLYTYEYTNNSYEEVNITEEALTNAIISLRGNPISSDVWRIRADRLYNKDDHFLHYLYLYE